jgi:hypothetical protein
MDAVFDKVNVREAAKTMAIVIGFAIIYALMTIYSPVFAKSSFAGMVFGKTLRLANMLRAFALITPLAPIGTAIGSASLKLGSGLTEYVGTTLNLLLGLFIYRQSQRFGRSMVKDLSLLAFYGLVSGLIVTVTHAGFASLLGIAGFKDLVTEMLTFKMLTSMVIYMAGYPFVGVWELVRRPR